MTWTQKALLIIGALVAASWQPGSAYLSRAVCVGQAYAMDTCLVQAFSGSTPAVVLIALVRDCGVLIKTKDKDGRPDTTYNKSLSL